MKAVKNRVTESVNGNARPILIWLTCLLVVAAGMFLSDARILNSVSAFKPLMIGTTNELASQAFWNSNTTLIENAIGGPGGGGGGGGSGIYIPTDGFYTNGSGQIGFAPGVNLKYLISNNAANLTNLNATNVVGTLPTNSMPGDVLTNNNAGVVTVNSNVVLNNNLTVATNGNFGGTVNAGAAAVTAGISGGSLTVTSNSTFGGLIQDNGTNFQLINPNGNSVVLSLVGQAAGGASNSISTSPAGLFLNSPANLIVTAPAGETVSGPLTVQNNATINTNLTVGGTLSVTGASTLGGNVGVAGTGTFSGAVTANAFTPTAGSFNGSGAGLTGVPGSSIVGAITASNWMAFFSGLTTYPNQPNNNGVQLHIGVNSGALAIRGSPQNTNSLSVENGLGAQFIQDWAAITPTASNVVANIDTNGNLTLKNGGKLYGAVVATNIDNTLGFTNLSGCYHDCQYGTNGSMLISGANFFGGPFTPGDVGKEIDIFSGSFQVEATISAYLSGNTVTLSGYTAASTFTNQWYAWGHDDFAAISNQTYNLTNGSSFIWVAPGQYMVNTWSTLPYSAGYAGIVLPFTNCDIKFNGMRTITFAGVQKPALCPALNSSFPEPLSTNGAIFCFPSNAPSATAAACIGCPNAPTTLTGGFLGVTLCLRDLTFRSASNWNGAAVIGGRYLGGMQLQGTVVVDSGTPTPYNSAPTTATSYGVYFPVVENYSDVTCDTLFVEGFYTGVFVNEHIRANSIWIECCRNAMQLGSSYHNNWISRFLCQGCGIALYNAGAVNHTCFGTIDIEEDETLVANLNFSYALYDASGDQYGGCDAIDCNVASGVWGTPTNFPPVPRYFKMPNIHPLPWGPFTFTGAGYTNTNCFPVQVFATAGATNMTYSNNIPTLQWSGVTSPGAYAQTLLPGETLTNASASLTVSREGN